MAAEEVVGIKRRLAVEQMTTHLHEKRITAVEIVVGEKKAGPPEFKHQEDQRRGEQIAAEQNAEARLPIASPGKICRGEARKSQNGMFGIAPHDLTEILRRGGRDFKALRGAKIFITGGTGFFGKWLLAALDHAEAEMNLGLRLTLLSRRPRRFLERWPEAADRPGWNFFEGDVAEVPNLLPRFDYIVHAAADTTAFAHSEDEAVRARAIVEGTERMLDLALRSRAKRLLNISSGAVYGARAGVREGAREEDFENAVPVTAYGIAKRAAEELLAASEIDFVTARAFAFLGPHLPLDAHYAAGNFIRDALRGGPIEVRGDGTALRSYHYPTDLVVWLLGILARGQKGRAYNVGSDEVVSTAELARAVAKEIEPAPEVAIRSVQSQGPQNIYLPNVARAREELGLEVGVPLQESIRRTLAFGRPAN
jgi:nucleoside-diphosphate-sugar epimerase